MPELIDPGKVMSMMKQTYGQAGPEQIESMFSEMREKFEARAIDFIPDADINSVQIGYVERIGQGRVLLAILEPTDDNAGITMNMFSTSLTNATKFGAVDRQLPVAIVSYRTDRKGPYKQDLIPWDISTFAGYGKLVTGFKF